MTSTTSETTYPNPDDTNPATRDRLNLGEAPVAVRSDDRRDELRDAEGTHEGERRALHEEEAVRTRDEDEGLRDDGDLEVHDSVELRVVVVERLGRAVAERDAELAVEPVRADRNRDEGDPVHPKHVSIRTSPPRERSVTYVESVR